jgi:NTP pyrophosphatase (non-canonical NTP hydrolase)
MLSKENCLSIIDLTKGHDDNYLILKASEELNELAIELLKYVKFANIASGRKEAVKAVGTEIVDVELVLHAMCFRMGVPSKDVPMKIRLEIEEEIRSGGVWGLSAGVMESARIITELSKTLIQWVTKRKAQKAEELGDHVMEVRCHLHKLCTIFFVFEQWFNATANEKMRKLQEYNKTIPGFGTIIPR